MIEESIKDICKKLFEHEIVKITVDYSGGNDEGFFENIKFFNKENVEKTIFFTEIFGEDTEINEEAITDKIANDDQLNQYGSFAGEYSCNGTITINTENGDFDDDGQMTYEEYDSNPNSGNIYGDAA